MFDSFRRVLIASVVVTALLMVGCQNPTPTVPAIKAQVPRIRAQELKGLLDAGEKVVIVDTRARSSYEQQHVEGAISLPLPETEARQGELPRDSRIVFYCS